MPSPFEFLVALICLSILFVVAVFGGIFGPYKSSAFCAGYSYVKCVSDNPFENESQKPSFIVVDVKVGDDGKTYYKYQEFEGETLSYTEKSALMPTEGKYVVFNNKNFIGYCDFNKVQQKMGPALLK